MSQIDISAARMRYDAEPEAFLQAARARLMDTAQGSVTATDIEQATNTLIQKFARLDRLAWAIVILTADAPTPGEARYRQILSTTRWLQSLGLPLRHSNGLPASQPKGVPDLPPTNRANRSLVKFVFGEEDEHEEALYGTANHRISEGS
ncbi:hypothetical protein ACT2E5_13455 [Burkholderia vietnamiensis]|uniref:hypothetical protein n=1 Tax=Burkholderia vietnamiensis TaxID=60552 RepID=UPI00402AC089